MFCYCIIPLQYKIFNHVLFLFPTFFAAYFCFISPLIFFTLLFYIISLFLVRQFSRFHLYPRPYHSLIGSPFCILVPSTMIFRNTILSIISVVNMLFYLSNNGLLTIFNPIESFSLLN